jgi:hypothetical protein
MVWSEQMSELTDSIARRAIISGMTRQQRSHMLQDAIMNMVERNDAEEIERFVIQQFGGDADQVIRDYAEPIHTIIIETGKTK